MYCKALPREAPPTLRVFRHRVFLFAPPTLFLADKPMLGWELYTVTNVKK